MSDPNARNSRPENDYTSFGTVLRAGLMLSKGVDASLAVTVSANTFTLQLGDYGRFMVTVERLSDDR